MKLHEISKQYWFVYRKSDKKIIAGAFDREEEANDVLADLDSDDYDVGLGTQVGTRFQSADGKG